MDRKPIVILIEQNVLVKNRIRQILSAIDLEIIEVNSPSGLLNLISKKVRLVITDIEFNSNTDFMGRDILNLIRSRNLKVPIMVVSSNSKKEDIMRCMLSGANEYILKPFNDEVLKAKILKCLDINLVTEKKVVKFELRDYLNREIYKASKGNYTFSLLKVDFCNKKDRSKDNLFYKYADHIYGELKKVYWDGDLYISQGIHSHLGFFPFCSDENIVHIQNKIDAQFKLCQNTIGELENYETSFTFACYPQSGKSANELLQIIGESE